MWGLENTEKKQLTQSSWEPIDSENTNFFGDEASEKVVEKFLNNGSCPKFSRDPERMKMFRKALTTYRAIKVKNYSGCWQGGNTRAFGQMFCQAKFAYCFAVAQCSHKNGVAPHFPHSHVLRFDCRTL